MSIKRNIPWSEIETVTNKHVDWFRFIPDINKWVRVIQRGGGDDFAEEIYIELHPDDLHSVDADWSGVRNALVKTTKEFGNNNYYHHALPKRVVDRMVLQMGERFTNLLMNFDYVKRSVNDEDFIRILPRIQRRSALFANGVPLAFLGANALTNKDHALLLSSLDEYYGSYHKVDEEPHSAGAVPMTAMGYALAQAKFAV